MKMYVKKVYKVEGKALFKGQRAATIFIQNKTGHHYTYNLIGDYSCFETNKWIPLYSATTQKLTYYGFIRDDENHTRIVNDNTTGDYIVIK